MLSSLEDKHNEVMKLAYYDQDTMLPNRFWVFTEFDHSISHYQEKMAVLYLDLDGFKRVNDSLGHKIGDALIIQLCERLSPLIDRENGILARFESDEFLILQRYKGKEHLIQSIQYVMEEINREYDLFSNKTTITASFGVSIYPEDGKTLEQLLQNADIAMYEAKRKGKNQYQFYQDLTKASTYRHFLELENDLKFALKNQQFELYYQMIVNGRDEKIVGAEALLRWNHPTKGMIPPDQFIPIAEETGLMSAIGFWVLEEAVRELEHWHAKGHQDLTMAINLSKSQMRDHSYIEKLDCILRDSAIPASSLHIEITESDVHFYSEGMMKFTRELKKRNVKIALDDFGVGTSSLQYLKDLPLDILKLIKTLFEMSHPAHLIRSFYMEFLKSLRSLSLRS